jgi:putative transposase
MAFIDDMRARGHAVESICAVLTGAGCQIAARTYRSWKQPDRPVAGRTLSDAVVVDALLGTRGTPEQLYGRRKMTHHLRRQGLAVAFCTVDRLMKDLGLNGVRRSKGVRATTRAKNGHRAGDLLGRDFTAAAPNTRWVADFTYVRTWAGFVYVAFVVDVFAQRIIGWHAATSKATDLVVVPLRIAMWDRERQGHPVERDQLVHHSDAGSQGGFNWSSQHLVVEVFSGTSTAGSRPCDSSQVEVAWSSEVPAPCRGGVLGTDRPGSPTGGGRRCNRRGAGCRRTLVPQRWRHATLRSEVPAFGPVSVVR